MESSIENRMENMLVCTCAYIHDLLILCIFRMTVPGILGALCVDSQGLCISGSIMHDNVITIPVGIDTKPYTGSETDISNHSSPAQQINILQFFG